MKVVVEFAAALVGQVLPDDGGRRLRGRGDACADHRLNIRVGLALLRQRRADLAHGVRRIRIGVVADPALLEHGEVVDAHAHGVDGGGVLRV